MCKHYSTALLVLVGWAVLAPGAWVGSASAQPANPLPINISFNPNTTFTINGSLSSGSYQGNAADTTLLGGPASDWGTIYQDWYTVFLTAGQTYVFNVRDYTGLGGMVGISIQDFNGVQVALDYGFGNFSSMWNIFSQMSYVPPQDGTYTVIIYAIAPGIFQYQLEIPALTIAPTPLPLGSSSQQITPASYCGGAAKYTLGSPPALPMLYFSWPDYMSSPPWVNYGQNWYTVPLMAGAAYYILMSTAAAKPVLSLQNPSGTQQLAYDSHTGTANIHYMPLFSGNYIIVCSSVGTGTTNDVIAGPVTVPFALDVKVTPQGETSTTVTPPPYLAGGATGNVTVTVTSWFPGDGVPIGNVTLTIDGGSPITQTLTGNSPTTATATFTIMAPSGGVNHTLTAVYTPLVGPFTTSTGTEILKVIPIIPVAIPVNLNGSLNSSCYSGGAGDTALAKSTTTWDWSTFSGKYQMWYSIKLDANKTYIMSLTNTNADSDMSLQDSNGVQVAWSEDFTWWASSQMVYVPSVTGFYTIIVSTYSQNTNMTYTLTVPSPDAPTTKVISLPYSTTGAITASSYYGPADGSIGKPSPIDPTLNNSQISPYPAFVDYYQNRYTVQLYGTNTYAISVSSASSNVVLSIQSSTGVQVAYQAGPGICNFVPSANDIYTVIVTSTSSGPPAGTSYILTIPGPVWSVNGIPNVKLDSLPNIKELGTEVASRAVVGVTSEIIRESIIQATRLSPNQCWLTKQGSLIG